MAVIATDLKQLFEKIKGWYEQEIPTRRESNDSPGRLWYTDHLPWPDPLKVQLLKKATDRAGLNQEYVQRWKEDKPPARKGVSAHKLEISQLYSWNKTFVQRYKTRLHYYQDDTAFKKGRVMYNVWQSFSIFDRFKNETMNG
jgi:hypothetical protein